MGLSFDELKKAYLEDGLSINKVADKFHCSRSSVAQQITLWGLNRKIKKKKCKKCSETFMPKHYNSRYCGKCQKWKTSYSDTRRKKKHEFIKDFKEK